jgi:hypothetical protein
MDEKFNCLIKFEAPGFTEASRDTEYWFQKSYLEQSTIWLIENYTWEF